MERQYEIPVGQRTERFSVDSARVAAVINPPQSPQVANLDAELRRALQHPIGSETLKKIAAGKKTAAIVINDITRPYPGREMVEALTRELLYAGIEPENIRLILAYGHHRDNTPEELRQMLGEEIVSRFEIIHHHADDPSSLAYLGTTSMGIPVSINRAFAQSDIKILTGCITPHQLAGFSGGRKSVLPGISGMNTLRRHHSFPIRPNKTSLGWLEGNPFHEQAMEAARIAGVDFILNSVDNAYRGVVRCVAGDLKEAYLEGVALCREIWSVEVSRQAEIVLVSPGGYPRDFDLHQSQKALGCAEMLCKPGGRIILCAQMKDGAGRPGKVLEKAACPAQVIQEFSEIGYTPDALSKAYMIARALDQFKISIACSEIPSAQLGKMFFDSFPTVQEALKAAFLEQGPAAKLLIVPYASDVLPILASGSRNS